MNQQLNQAIHEKLQWERHAKFQQSQNTSSCKQQSDSSISSSFAQRKITDLSQQVQSLHATVAEKNRQLDDMRRQVERNLSQSRLSMLQQSKKKRMRV